MLVNDPESLKSWLIIVLEPLCDADSSALARYVLALLKKDKPVKELKKVMIEQLDVFLSVETKPFVEKLFNAINSEEYRTTIPDITQTAGNEGINLAEIKTEHIQNISSDIKMSDASSSAYIKKEQTPPIEDVKAKDITTIKTTDTIATIHCYKETPAILIQPELSANVQFVNESSIVKATSDKENQPRESRRRRASFRSRSRSRSRSNDRISRRSRSRERRPIDREKNQRQFRNKSPPISELRHLGTHDRRRGVISGGDRRRIGGNGIGSSDDRSPRFGGSGGEGRKGRTNRSNSHSRSPSLDRNTRVKCSPTNVRSARGSPERHHHVQHVQHVQHENEKRQRCRDFDEKGYCVRGETCPWDHGVNPVVFEGINNSALISMSLREYNPDAPDLWSRGATTADNAIVGGNNPVSAASTGINPFTGTTRSGAVMVGIPAAGVGFCQPTADKLPNASCVLPGEYQRTPNFRGAAPMIPFPFNPAAVTTPLQRELIPIPVVDAGTAGGDISTIPPVKRRFLELEDSVAIADGPTKRKIPLNSRLGPRIPNLQNNCSLELRKIPRGLNTIAHLNNHFAKFGKIVNIQITYDGDPEAAIITFSTHAEANVAYRSTEAVLNNRFIKVFWHNQDLALAGSSHTLLKEDNMNVSLGVGNRKNSQYHVNNVPAIPTPTFDSAKITNSNDTQTNSSTATIPTEIAPTNLASTGGNEAVSTIKTPNNANVAAVTHIPPPSLRLKNNVQRLTPTASNAIRKKQEEQAKAVVQLANGLRKRKQELLQSYVKQMKSALELVERCEPNDPQRSKTFATIKVLQETIDKLRKEIATEQEQIQAQIQNQQPPQKKTKEQQKKELLDIELELFAQQQEGNDTSSIQKRLEELQRSLGIMPGSITNNTSSNSIVTGSGKLHFAGNRSNSRGRPTFPEVSTRVDRRPKTIVVTGFTKDEADFVLGHFKHFGEITKHDVDKDIPQLILSYATRLNAEQAILRGKLFKDKRLQISWAPVVSSVSSSLINPPPLKGQETGGEDIQASNASDIENTDTLPELRLEDEEEEEESEDRSWRR